MVATANVIREILEVVGLDGGYSSDLVETATKTVESLKEILDVVDQDADPF